MQNLYRCDICGCYLDPGENFLCDECQEKSLSRAVAAQRMREAVRETESGQVEMILQEVY